MIPPGDNLFKWVKLYHKIHHFNVSDQYFKLRIERYFLQSGHTKIGWVLGTALLQCEAPEFFKKQIETDPFVAAFPFAELVSEGNQSLKLVQTAARFTRRS